MKVKIFDECNFWQRGNGLSYMENEINGWLADKNPAIQQIAQSQVLHYNKTRGPLLRTIITFLYTLPASHGQGKEEEDA